MKELINNYFTKSEFAFKIQDTLKLFFAGLIDNHYKFFKKTYRFALIYTIYAMLITVMLFLIFRDYFSGIGLVGFQTFFFNHFDFHESFDLFNIGSIIFTTILSIFSISLFRIIRNEKLLINKGLFVKLVKEKEFVKFILIGLIILAIDNIIYRIQDYLTPFEYDPRTIIVKSIGRDIFTYFRMFLIPIVFSFFVCRTVIGNRFKISTQFVVLVAVNFFFVNSICGELQNVFKKIFGETIGEIITFNDVLSLMNIIAAVPFIAAFFLGYGYVLIFPAFLNRNLQLNDAPAVQDLHNPDYRL